MLLTKILKKVVILLYVLSSFLYAGQIRYDVLMNKSLPYAETIIAKDSILINGLLYEAYTGDEIYSGNSFLYCHYVERGDTFDLICKIYKVTIKDILRENNWKTLPPLYPGDKIALPGDPYILSERLRLYYQKRLVPVKGFIWPVKKGKGIITSYFGRRLHPIFKTFQFHNGIDIAVEYGEEIQCVRDGKVIFTGYKNKYGRVVEIKHDNGNITMYAHLSRIFVKCGESVKAGRVIGKAGRTGVTTGSHLHFSVFDAKNRALNPLKFLNI